MKYIAKKHPIPNDDEDEIWYDEGTEAALLVDLRDDPCKIHGAAGIFRGIRNGETDEEICSFDEFDIIE